MKFKILHYGSVDSTNTKAKELSEKGAKEGTVILADYQTKGRGRLNRRWHSKKGKDLLFSVILRPKHLPVNSASIITKQVGMMIQDFLISEYQLNAKMKHPNDILIDGKKICGILVEGSAGLKTMDYLIVGIGININSTQKDLIPRATSLYLETDQKENRLDVLKGILTAFRKTIPRQ